MKERKSEERGTRERENERKREREKERERKREREKEREKERERKRERASESDECPNLEKSPVSMWRVTTARLQRRSGKLLELYDTQQSARLTPVKYWPIHTSEPQWPPSSRLKKN